MKKIGITGSLASGKTTASKYLSLKKGPLFSADDVVKNLYKKKGFKISIAKKFNLKSISNLKENLKKKIFENTSNIKKLEKIIHPLVRKQMKNFIKKNKKRKLIFLEIPLLIESKLMSNFDIIFFIKAKKNIRLRRFCSKGGSKKLFHILNKKQFSDTRKAKYCDYTVVNEKNFKILRRNLLGILKKYE